MSKAIAPAKKRTYKRKLPKPEPVTLVATVKQISARVGVLGFALTLLTSFTLPGALTTAITGDLTLNESGTSNIIQNIKLTAPLTIGLTIIFFIFLRQWIQNVLVFYMVVGLSLTATSVLFSKAGREVVAKAWNDADGNLLFSFPTNLIKEYYILYFWAPFVGSFLTAIFLTWALNKLWYVRSLK